MLIVGIIESDENSNIFLFTDADAKDEEKKNDVMNLAVAKNIKVNPILTGKCSKRKKRESGQWQVKFLLLIVNLVYLLQTFFRLSILFLSSVLSSFILLLYLK